MIGGHNGGPRSLVDKVRTSPSGKRIWPNDLKRLQEEGMPRESVAADLDAYGCLVRDWCVADRAVDFRKGMDCWANYAMTNFEVDLLILTEN